MPTNVTIPLHLIDEPEVAMRSDISDDYLRELADNIAEQGLHQPIGVKANGERFRIGYGHCRFLAHKLLGKENIEARDYTADSISLEAMKITENLCRNDVSDADTATYLHDIQTKYRYDIETLMRMTRRSEGWINMRLGLFRGDMDVFAALQRGDIKLGHALVLNRFPDNFRAQYLQSAINSTPPIKVIEQWLVDLRKLNLEGYEKPEEGVAPTPGVVLPGVKVEACTLCGGDQMNWTMIFPRVHEHCMKMIVDKIREAEG